VGAGDNQNAGAPESVYSHLATTVLDL